MDFALTDEQLEFKERCRTFAREVIRPAAPKHDREESIPWEVIKEARKQGFGGARGDPALGRRPAGPDAGDLGRRVRTGAAPAPRWRSPAPASPPPASPPPARPSRSCRWVPECFGSGDEIKLGAYAVTEPQAGSDVKSLKTTAKRDGDEWVLDGTKVFITNGGIADVHVVVATVDPELGTRGQASFVVGKDTPGLRQGKKETKLGIRASHTAEVVLERLPDPGRQPARRRGEAGEQARARPLGPESSRSADALATFEMTRPIVGASALGIAQAAYEWTLEYLDGREEGGMPMLKAQRIQQTLADVATEIEAARLLVQRAAWMGRNGVPMTRRPGLDVEAQGRRRDDVGDDDADGPGRPRRLEHRVPAGEVVPRRQDLPAVRGHGGDPAHGHLADAGARIRRAARLRRRSRRRGRAAPRRPSRSPPERRPNLGVRRTLRTHDHAGHSHGFGAHSLEARREDSRRRMVWALGDQPRPASRSRSSAASSPARWRSSPTPATCSPTSARSSSP